MGSGFEAGSYLRLIDFVYHSTRAGGGYHGILGGARPHADGARVIQPEPCWGQSKAVSP